MWWGLGEGRVLKRDFGRAVRFGRQERQEHIIDTGTVCRPGMHGILVGCQAMYVCIERPLY